MMTNKCREFPFGLANSARALRCSASFLASVAVLGWSASAFAQTEPGEAAASGNSGDIVVTAQKREQNIQDVPASVSAVSGEELVTAGATSLSDYAAFAPGFHVTGGGTPGQASITLRGLPPLSAGAVVGTYIDDTPVGSTGNFSAATFLALDLMPYDLDRLEILRGPQGTLYGAGAMGGLVKYVLSEPDLDDFELRAGGDLFDVRHADGVGHAVRAMVSAPIVEGQLGVRFSGYDARSPGFIDNVLTGEDDVNVVRQRGGRAALLWRPSARFSLKLNAMLSRIESDDNSAISAVLTGLPSDPDAPFIITAMPLGNGLVQSFAFSQPFRKEVDYYSATARFDAGIADLVSATSWTRSDTRLLRDLSPFFGGLYPLVTGGAVDAGLTLLDTRLRHEKFTQEFRAASDGRGMFDWLVGVFYTDEKARNSDIAFATDVNYAPIPRFQPSFVDLRTPSGYEEFALFGEVTFRPSEKVELTLGARQAWNDQRYEEITSGEGAAFLGLNGSGGVLRSSEDVFTWSASARYHVNDDVMIYGRVATGYRPGGPNFPFPGIPDSVLSDTLTNYEAGLKSQFLDRRLLVNATAFFIDWEDIQLNVDNGSGITFLGNAGNAEIQGFEFEARVFPIERLSLAFNAAYTKSELVSSIPGTQPFVLGVQLPNVPKWSLAATADYSVPLGGDWNLELGGAWRYVDDRFASAVMTQAGPPTLILDSYDVVDLRVGVSTSRWSVRLFAKNLTDERGYTGISSAGVGGQTDLSVIQPRTFGVSLDVKY